MEAEARAGVEEEARALGRGCGALVLGLHSGFAGSSVATGCSPTALEDASSEKLSAEFEEVSSSSSSSLCSSSAKKEEDVGASSACLNRFIEDGAAAGRLSAVVTVCFDFGISGNNTRPEANRP